MKFPSCLSGLMLALFLPLLHAQTETTSPPPGREVLDQIVAVVNDDVIMRSELESATREVSAQLKEKNTPLPPQPVLEKQVLEKLILEHLQLQLADSNGIKIDDITLNNKLQEIAKQNGVSLTEFRAVLEREGYDYGTFRENIRHQLTIAKLRHQMVGSRITASEQEVDNLLATLEKSQTGNIEYHLSHILVATPDAASEAQIEAARRKADSIVAKLRAGADFTQTAIAESDAPTALEGGDIGWRSAGQLPSLFVDPVKEMHPGDIHDPIRSPSGFHIIKLVEQRGDERHIVNQTHVRHILLKTDAVHTNEAVKARMDQLELRLKAGEDFATLAKSNSQDALSAAKGGDLGWVNPGDLVPKFEDVMNNTAVGQISQPFETEFGWHILQVLARREHDSTEEYKRSQARQLIRKRKGDEELFLWLRRLRDEAYVEYRLDTQTD
jgi:peptidyl-prolyl cis-trans isomerase SurA